MEIFEKLKSRTESVSLSTQKNENESTSMNKKSDLSNPKASKPKNKKKKKWSCILKNYNLLDLINKEMVILNSLFLKFMKSRLNDIILSLKNYKLVFIFKYLRWIQTQKNMI